MQPSSNVLTLPAREGVVLEAAPQASTLERAEEALRDALDHAERSTWKAIFLVYEIYQSGLWRSGYDPDGVPYTDWERYVADLKGRVPKMSVRWSQEMIAVVTICTEALGISREEMVKCSPSALRETKKLLVWNQKERSVEAYNVEGGRDAVIALVHDAASPGTRYADIRKRVRSALKRPEVSWGFQDATKSTMALPYDYCITAYYDDLPYRLYATNAQAPHAIPDEVFSDLKRRLGVL